MAERNASAPFALTRETPLIPGLRPDLLPQGEKGRSAASMPFPASQIPRHWRPSPLAGEGGAQRRMRGVREAKFLKAAPSAPFALTREKPLIPGLRPDLLPQGEKGRSAASMPFPASQIPRHWRPSPLAGEGGAQRRMRGVREAKFLKAAPSAPFALTRENPLIPGLRPDLLPQGEKGRGGIVA
jgi:hypothetical protein